MTGNMNDAVFGCPDLKKAIGFMADFGHPISAEQAGSVYFRGAKGRPYLFVLKETDKPRLIATASGAHSEGSLRAIAQRLGASVGSITDTPSGGLRAVATYRDGNGVEIVHGVKHVAPLPMPRAEIVFNSNGQVRRKGRQSLFSDAPAPVFRLRHVVHESSATVDDPGNASTRGACRCMSPLPQAKPTTQPRNTNRSSTKPLAFDLRMQRPGTGAS